MAYTPVHIVNTGSPDTPFSAANKINENLDAIDAEFLAAATDLGVVAAGLGVHVAAAAPHSGHAALAHEHGHGEISDWDTVVTAALATKAGLTANNLFENDVAEILINAYAESGETTRKAVHVLRTADAGAHSGYEHSGAHDESRPVGSGLNGAASADYARTISIVKQNWLYSTVPGEIDGLCVVVRQGGPDGGGSDSAALLGNCQVIGSAGYLAFAEAHVSQIERGTWATLRDVITHIGVIDPVSGNYLGYVATATKGALTTAFLSQNDQANGGSWAWRSKHIKNGAVVYSVDDDGNITGRTIKSEVASGTAPLIVASATKVTNLNADLLDGLEATAFAAASHGHPASAVSPGTFGAAYETYVFNGPLHLNPAFAGGTAGAQLVLNGAAGYTAWASSVSANGLYFQSNSASNTMAKFENTGTGIAWIGVDGFVDPALGFKVAGAAASGKILRADGSYFVAADLPTREIVFELGNGVDVIAAATQKVIRITAAATIVEWTILADVSGSIQFDLFKDTLANYPPTVADTITASAKPAVSSGTNASSSTLTGWTTAIAAGDVVIANVDSCTTIKRAYLILKVQV